MTDPRLLALRTVQRLGPLYRNIPYIPPGMTFDALPHVYDSEVGGPATGILEVHVTGPLGGTWTLDIRPRGIKVHSGPSKTTPDTRLHTDAFTWTAMATGRTDGTTAFMKGRMEMEGDIRLSLKLESCFGGKS